MLQNLLDIDRPDYYKNIFKGVVVDNNDPLKLERVRVQVIGLYEGTDLTLFPWCISFKRLWFGSGSGFGEFGVPRLGSVVAIMLQHGDAHFPIYLGSALEKGNTVPDAATNYPNRYGFKDPVGNIFFVDMQTHEVKFTHVSGTVLDIAANGDVSITGVGNGTVTVPGTLTLQGNLTVIKGTTSITLQTPSLDFAVTGTSQFTGGGSVDISGASSVALP